MLCRVRRRTITTLVATGLVATTAQLAFAGDVPDYKTMIVKARRQSVQATLGTHCVPTADGNGDCSEATYPLKTTGVLKVHRGDSVTLLFAAAVGDVRWRAARIDGRGEEQLTATGIAKVVTKTKKRWKISIPKNLRRSSKLLGFDVRSPNAYASFEVGLVVQ